MYSLTVILNPYAGRGRADRLQHQIAAALAAAGIEFDLALTKGPGHAIELAETARRGGCEVVAAAGGDGTVSEVVNGLARAAGPDGPVGMLALLPIGSGNDFANAVGCPRNLHEAAARIARGTTRRVDLGRAVLRSFDEHKTRYFDNSMGLGLEAQVTLESYRIRRLQGRLLYIAAALRTLHKYRAPHVEVRVEGSDGAPWHSSMPTLLVSIGNSPRCGGGFYLTPAALLDDGLFDIAVARAVPAWRALLLLPRALAGKHTTDRAVTMLRSPTLHAHCAAGLPIHLDGEVVGERVHEVNVQILPGRLTVIV